MLNKKMSHWGLSLMRHFCYIEYMFKMEKFTICSFSKINTKIILRIYDIL